MSLTANTLLTPSLSVLLGHTATLVQAVRGGASLSRELERHCPTEVRSGVQALTFTVMRRLGSALALRELLVAKAPGGWVDALLLSALALAWPEADEPAPYTGHTLVNQAVAACKRRVPAQTGLVNAVLRRFMREADTLKEQALQTEGGRWNHPPWWIARLQQDWPQDWQALLKANQKKAPLYLRVNKRWGTAQDYQSHIEPLGLIAKVCGPQSLELQTPAPITTLPGYREGWFSVQDLSAQQAASLLMTTGLTSGSRVLDACAAPGGKTTHLLELADLEVVALDQDIARLEKINQSLQRLSLQATLIATDARELDTWWDGRLFDAVLLDAPCSASGIVRRHPDVRWLRRESDISSLCAVQAGLLDRLWQVLKPNAHLLYCTCSVFKAEGKQQIEAFMQRNPQAKWGAIESSPGYLLQGLDNQLQDQGTQPTASLQNGSEPGLLRGVSDGFYYALLQKNYG
jgi:16S rRNA (cytosine967-C5)-methyltransferase